MCYTPITYHIKLRNESITMTSLGRMAIITIDMPRMVAFYHSVFDANLTPVSHGDFTFYEGRMGNLGVTLAPNAMLGIRSENSRHQLSFVVPNLETALAQALQTGARQMEEISVDDNEYYCGILDPDGNSIELIEHR